MTVGPGTSEERKPLATGTFRVAISSFWLRVGAECKSGTAARRCHPLRPPMKEKTEKTNMTVPAKAPQLYSIVCGMGP